MITSEEFRLLHDELDNLRIRVNFLQDEVDDLREQIEG